MISTSGVIETIAGTGPTVFSGDGGLAVDANLASPLCVIITTNGEIIFTDMDNERIRKISTIAETGAMGYSGDSGFATNAVFSLPTFLALNPASGDIYVTYT